MPKRKQVLVSKRYISFIKDRLPYSDQEFWWEMDKNKLKNKDWLPVSKIPIQKDKDIEDAKDERGLHPKLAKKIKKLKLKYTMTEVKRAVEEDEESLKDVKKLEHHLEEDIAKAKEKLKEK